MTIIMISLNIYKDITMYKNVNRTIVKLCKSVCKYVKLRIDSSFHI